MNRSHGSKDATAEQRWTIEGEDDGRLITELEFWLSGTSDTGDTLAFSELARISVDHLGTSPLDMLVNNCRPYEIIALNRYLQSGIYYDFDEAGTTEVNFSVLFNVLPNLKGRDRVNCFLLKNDHRLVVEGAAASADLARGTIELDDTYLHDANMNYLVRYRRIQRNLSDGEAFRFPKNTVYVVIAPATTTAPTQLRLFQGNRRVAKGSWSKLLQRTRKKQGMQLDATHVIIDVAEKGNDRAVMANQMTLEHDGGSGTMEIMYVTIEWAKDLQEDAKEVSAKNLGAFEAIVISQGGGAGTIEGVSRTVSAPVPISPRKRTQLAVERKTQMKIN